MLKYSLYLRPGMKEFIRLLQYVRPHWATFVVAIVAMFAVAFFETAIGTLLIPIFEQFMPETARQTPIPFDLHRYIPSEPWYSAWFAISAFLIVFTVGKGIAEYFSSYLMARIGQSAVLKLRRELYSHLLRQSASFFDKQRTNFLVSRLVVSCSSIEMAVSNNLRDVLREGIMLVFFIGAGFYFSWKLMLGALIIAPVIAFLTTKFSKALRRLADVSLEGNKMLNDTAQETLSNNAIVKAYRAEERENTRFEAVARIIAKANLRGGRIGATSPPVIELVGAVVLVVLLFFGLREINQGNLEPAQFFAFIYFLFRSYDPMRKISRQHNELSRAFAGAKDVWDMLDQDERMPEDAAAVELTPLAEKIEIKEVSFGYGDPDRVAVRGLSLDIPSGSMIALVGESGGGKSTLVKLVQRLYDPEEGAILWDGIDIRRAKLASLRSQIALVTQENVLFNDTIRYNISYGRPDASDEDIRNAARIAYADVFIEALPEGYDTFVGERGTFLSGGQRQRLAIARAVMVDAPVLILDEATSALDAESEELVQKALANLMKGRTSIVIAHRLSTVRKADRIVVMEKGKIIENGSHDELIAAGGRYKRLYDLQFAYEQDHSVEPAF
ncbi:MAG TPA: ABC transporter transmembrane domain-containing protein [Pyrinomonadaceae bacterium]|nr:ABC transporter transmembrane domain-containing protein [Pyrinomonadaceae bacterium]HMP66723.1 ABC transporter transmembrane domain-containing protein [Pyrinomonadaceae bacterium]